MQMALVYLQQGNVIKSKKFLKIVNIDEGSLHIFKTTCGISMKFSEKSCFRIILKITKNQGFPLSRKYSLGKATGSCQKNPRQPF